MNIPFQGTLDRSTVSRAVGKQLRPLRVLGGIFITLSLGSVLLGLLATSSQAREQTLTPVTAFFGLIGVAFCAAPYLSTRKLFATSKIVQAPLSGTVSDTGVTLHNAFGDSNLPWDAFYGAAVRSDVVFLYQSAYNYNLFPRAFFQDDHAWHEFKSLVRARVRPKPTGLRNRLLLWVVILVLVLLWFRLSGGA
jgi:YcxB-like protein